MITREELIRIGRFNKPHGVKGELSFTFTDDVFDRTECSYIVCEIDGIFVPFFIEEYRFKSDTTALIKLEDVDNEADARPFTLLDVYFPKSYYKESNEDEAPGDYFIGFTVIDSEKGVLGRLSRSMILRKMYCLKWNITGDCCLYRLSMNLFVK